MAGASDYLENKLLDHLFNNAAFTAPTNIFVALLTTTPVDSDTGITIDDATYTGYTRVSTAAADWNSASGGSLDNLNAITFGLCTAGSDTITHFALCDSLTNGELLTYGTCSLSVSVNVTPSFASGQLTTTLD